MARLSPERERLTQLINQWNVDHYELFVLSKPNEDLEFHGVVRFYFQGADGANVITKCVRVSSTATTRDVIETLIEKFRPDMRMLTQSKYALYEVHVNGEERRLADDEKPLWVQLNWGNDVREGRFLLKNENEETVRDRTKLGFPEKEEAGPNFKRRLSKREKKEKKKREQEQAKQDDSVANKLYSEAPETSFTRSISNPEAVMRRRRQQKLEKKLAQMQSREGGPDSGGTLKIYGGSLRPDVPYKTLLLSTADTTQAVVREAMEKYGLDREEPDEYCLVEVLLPPGSREYHGDSSGDERVLDDSECPLAIVMQHPESRGHIIFQLRRRKENQKQRSKTRPRAVSHDDLRKTHEHSMTQVDKLPYLLELNPRDGKPKKHLLPLNVTEVVRDKPRSPGNQFLQLQGPDIQPRHCVIAHTEGIVTVTPTSRDAEIYIDRRPVYETTMLRHGMIVEFGRNHIFRFVDPRIEEVSKPGHPVPAPRSLPPQETNFDVDGHVETVSVRPGQQHSETRGPGRDVQGRAPPTQVAPANGHESQPDLLPASLEYRLEAEDRLLQAAILEVNSRAVQFKLAPTYTLYLAARRLLAARIQLGIAPNSHSQMVLDFVSKTSKFIQQAIQEHHNNPTALAFWMANASEVLHFFKQDADIQVYSSDLQELLAEAVQMAFHHLVRCLQGDLQRVMPAFLNPSNIVDEENAPPDQYTHGSPMLTDVLNTLSAAMTLLRRCRVNAALTIQLFSQLFHFINMWLFNILVMEPQLRLCTRAWGLRLKRRLGRVEAWAEKQGLELAADCHLCRIIQAAHLLQASKVTADDITNISSTCFKLNSLQLRALLTQYIPDAGEPQVAPGFVERVVVIAENMADELTRTDGRDVRLEEDADLQLPFLLPEDGYSCDTIRGIPSGLPEFVSQLTNTGTCHLVPNPKASGSWTVYMGPSLLEPSALPEGQPEIVTVSFKKVKGSMGLSIVAAVGEGLKERGIYIKSVVPGGAAALDGRLKNGDQLLEVDGKNLIGLSQDKAAELMTQTGDVVTLRVAKQGAFYHGLATLLSEPSPVAQRRGPDQTKAGPSLRGEEGPPPYVDRRQNGPSETQRMPQAQQRPVPQPRGQAGQTNKDGPERMRSPSTGNLANSQYSPQDPASYSRREIDPRSKSTSNLHVDTSFDPYPHMRGAASVGMLHPSAQGHPQYPAGGQRQDVLHNDYENQPQVSSGNGPVSYLDTNQSIKPGFTPSGPPAQQHLQPGGHRPSDRSSVSSRASSNSARDVRPQSAYYDPQPLHDDYGGYNARPKSEDVTTNKLREWQEKYDPQAQTYRDMNGNAHSPSYVNQNQGLRSSEGPGQSAPHAGQSRGQPASRDPDMNQGLQYSNHNPTFRASDSASHSPPYTNIGAVSQHRAQQQPSEPKLTAHQRLFGNQGAIQSNASGAAKPAANNRHRQPNLYENAAQEPATPFQRQTSEGDKSKPAVMPKPAIVAKKPQPPSQSSDVPYSVTDNRQVQPGLYGNSSRTPAGPGGTQQYPQTGYPDQRVPTESADPRSRPQQQDLRPPQQDLRPLHQQEPRLPQQQDPRLFLQDFRNTQQDARSFQQADPRSFQQADPRSFQQQDEHDSHLQDPRFMQQDTRVSTQYQPDPRHGYSMQKFPSLRGDPGPYGYPAGQPDLPPPPMQDLPPELPPPLIEQEELPPLPPPPLVQDIYEQQLQDEQRRMMEAMNSEQPLLHPHNSYDRFGQTGIVGSGEAQPLTPGIGYNPLPQGMLSQQAPNYQNINFVSEVRANSGPASQAVTEHNVYEQYNSRPQPPVSQTQRSPLPSSYQLQSSASSTTPQSLQPSLVQGSSGYSMASAWDREEKERAQELQAEEQFRAREAEIAELESRMNFLSQQELERLRKLKLEHEFQRRVREIDEKGDYEPDDDDMAERLFTRDRLIQSLKDDLEKSQQRLQELNHRQMIQDAQKEKERLQRLERRLEMMEKDKQEMKERMEKRSQRRARDHQEVLRQQREAREKQRQNYEEQKKLLMIEEEKMRQQREEEVAKRRQMERERLQELQIARDNEEARLRAESRRQKDDYVTQQMLQQHQQRQEQNREIRVADERRRLESLSAGGGGASNNLSVVTNNTGHLNNGISPTNPPGIAGVPATNRPGTAGLGYQQYMNLPPSQTQVSEKENLAPPPPERRSSYNTSITRSNPDYTSLPFPQNQPQHPLQQQQNPNPAPTKKSVSFNTSMNTYQERTPSHSFSSDHNFSPIDQVAEEPNEVFQSPLKRQVPGQLARQEGTPNVIGSQEVYRDPRSRIEAQKAQQNPNKKPTNERMSFRDKMKYFAQEAGEDMPKNKPKASKTLRNIESQLNGQ